MPSGLAAMEVTGKPDHAKCPECSTDYNEVTLVEWVGQETVAISV